MGRGRPKKVMVSQGTQTEEEIPSENEILCVDVEKGKGEDAKKEGKDEAKIDVVMPIEPKSIMKARWVDIVEGKVVCKDNGVLMKNDEIGEMSNRSVSNGLKLNFVELKEDVIAIKWDDVADERLYWKHSLIGYVVHDRV
ncbi:hypothetical protein Droror1_Dr00020855 [Drosera rotundifolia]